MEAKIIKGIITLIVFAFGLFCAYLDFLNHQVSNGIIIIFITCICLFLGFVWVMEADNG